MERFDEHVVAWRRRSEPDTVTHEVRYWTAIHERDANAVRQYQAADPAELKQAREEYRLACEAGDVTYLYGSIEPKADLPTRTPR